MDDGEELKKEHGGTASDAKGVHQLKGVQDIPTSVSRRVRSLPPRQDRYYLELYLLQKEQDRLTKEASSTSKRRTRLSQRLADVGRETAEKEAKAMEGMSIVTGEPARDTGSRPKAPPKSKPKKHEYKEEEWQRMSIDY